MLFRSQVQFYDFEQFFEFTIGFGILSFNMPDPLKISPTAIECRMVVKEDVSPYSVSPIGGSDDLIVSFTIETLG